MKGRHVTPPEKGYHLDFVHIGGFGQPEFDYRADEAASGLSFYHLPKRVLVATCQ